MGIVPVAQRQNIQILQAHNFVMIVKIIAELVTSEVGAVAQVLGAVMHALSVYRMNIMQLSVD